MFIREKKNKSGSTSVQIISKHGGKYKVDRTIGSATTAQGLSILLHQARHELSLLQKQSSLFISHQDAGIEGFLNTLSNGDVSVVGPELVLGKLFDHIGFNAITESLFRHLVIARLAFPLSKLKTVDYLYRYQGIHISASTVYRFLDKLNSTLKEQVEQIAFKHTMGLHHNHISIVFYDMTTLYFETSDEDDLRKTGFSKDGKHQNPQIYLGLLVSIGGDAIGYDIFEGNIYEGHTLVPFIERISNKFNLDKPIVVADAGLLSNDNIKLMEHNGYKYILGARPKNETDIIRRQILQNKPGNDQHLIIARNDHTRLIISYSDKRASKDVHNRQRGLQRLEKQIKSGKLNKSNINNKGYNKYLKMQGDVAVSIDYEKFEADRNWDGIKGYITNTKLSARQIIDNYKQLWHIEKAFRMSKTDLRIRPIYHRLAGRIEAHICISFTAYKILKELERLLKKEKATFSVTKAVEITQNMYQIEVIMPETKNKRAILLKMTPEQIELSKIIAKNC